mmetsp:Transcript_50302/g.75145  ORF Transcript_50302/g.75145 Transcript_50302/m.75145 type:complete len:245 (+) Transcript_50302:880-1614(+)
MVLSYHGFIRRFRVKVGWCDFDGLVRGGQVGLRQSHNRFCVLVVKTFWAGNIVGDEVVDRFSADSTNKSKTVRHLNRRRTSSKDLKTTMLGPPIQINEHINLVLFSDHLGDLAEITNEGNVNHVAVLCDQIRNGILRLLGVECENLIPFLVMRHEQTSNVPSNRMLIQIGRDVTNSKFTDAISFGVINRLDLSRVQAWQHLRLRHDRLFLSVPDGGLFQDFAADIHVSRMKWLETDCVVRPCLA